MSELSNHLCECGCGGRTTVIAESDRTRGYIKGQPNRYIKGHKIRPTTPIPARFWPKINKDAAGGCWEWNAYRTREGYGTFWDGSTTTYAHRVAYELLVGPIPDGLVIDHLCRNRGCVNPEHLEPVTLEENWDRGLLSPSKTECIHGHAYTAENTYRRPDNGGRMCRTCRRDEARLSRSRRAVS